MKRLQACDLYALLFLGADAAYHRSGSGQCGYAGHSVLHCGPPDRLLVKKRRAPQWSIYDQIYLPALNQIYYVRAALFDFVDRLHVYSRRS
jgi:hypothetical protein